MFGRDATIDPQHDPVVRIEAAKLRRSLERYYLIAGQDDPIRMDIPKGAYVPTFEQRAGLLSDPSPAAGERAAVVLPLAPGHTRSRWDWSPAASLAIVLAALAAVAVTAWFGLARAPSDQNVWLSAAGVQLAGPSTPSLRGAQRPALGETRGTKQSRRRPWIALLDRHLRLRPSR